MKKHQVMAYEHSDIWVSFKAQGRDVITIRQHLENQEITIGK